jgi:hypothetical protein
MLLGSAHRVAPGRVRAEFNMALAKPNNIQEIMVCVQQPPVHSLK